MILLNQVQFINEINLLYMFESTQITPQKSKISNKLILNGIVR